LLFFLAFLSGVFSQSQPNGQVVELTDLDFDEFIAKNPVVMVLFYAPFCSKSKAFIPEFQKAAALAHKVGKTYILAKIDTSSQTEVADKLDIQMTPTVKLFINKTKTTYDKDLTMEGIIRYIDKSIRPASVEITQLFEVKALQDVKGFKVCLYKVTQ
jgi:thioredoxin-like negative regulator of GroEL